MSKYDRDTDPELPALYSGWRSILDDFSSGPYTPPVLTCRQLSEGFAIYDSEAVAGDKEDEPVITSSRILAWDRAHDDDLDADIFATWPTLRDLPYLHDL